MANTQKPLTYAKAVPIIACAILCCDRKAYPLRKRKTDKECERLGTKKHSCVLHKLRQHKGGKMTTNNKYKGIQASPRYKRGGKLLIPDIRVGNRIIDCKFPCNPPLKSGSGKFIQRSNMKTPGTKMLTSKERVAYKKIKNVSRVDAMTPADAQAKVTSSCKC